MQRSLAEVTDEQTISPHPSRLTVLWTAVAAGSVLHNAEEWLGNMTGWIADHPWLPGRSLHGDQAEFSIVLACVTAAVLAIAIIAVVTRPRWSSEVLVCVACALTINGLSHILLSLLSWSPMPGVITSITLLLPLGALVTSMLPPDSMDALDRLDHGDRRPGDHGRRVRAGRAAHEDRMRGR